MKRLAFAPGQTEPQMWCLADHNHPELLYKNEEKSWGGREVKRTNLGTELFMFMSSVPDKTKQPRANVASLIYRILPLF